MLEAGRIGRPHGLDGSFHVTRPEPSLLEHGMAVTIAGRATRIERRAGTDVKPIIRVEGCSTREGAEALRGEPLLVDRGDAPPLEPGEFWADDIVGCRVTDGEAAVGTVHRVVALPSCEVLEVVRPGSPEPLLVPLVRDAVRDVDLEDRRVDVDLAFLGETDGG